jgi:lysophospholipase L1-like esterase
VTTTGYTDWEVATALANGSTSQGYVDKTSQVGGSDGSVARHNLQSHMDQLQYLLLDQRRRDALWRKECRARAGVTPASTVKVMCCGDSITAGLMSSDNWGYPGWMIDLLDRQNIAMELSYTAHGGWYVTDVLANIQANLATAQPQIVTVHIGTNDAAAGPNSSYQANYTQLINDILAAPSVEGVVCALIPIAQAVSSTYQTGMENCNTIVSNIVTGMNNPRVVVADLRTCHESTWNAVDTWPGVASPPGRWTMDGMHPYDAGCIKTAEHLLQAAMPWIPGYTPAT